MNANTTFQIANGLIEARRSPDMSGGNTPAFAAHIFDGLVKSQQKDGTVKSSRCKARASFKAARRNIEE
jgi:hypothetical protein